MPVARLLVEGELDEALLVAVRPPDAPLIIRSGNKGSLAPRARELRKEKRYVACYLRDRDFDHEPPADTTRPSVDCLDKDSGGVLGWRWCRHEIENYLLEPTIVAAASGWDAASYATELVAAAHGIAHYTAARWILGRHRKHVSDERLFRTRPDLTNEIKLPEDLSAAASVKFLLDTLHGWEQRIVRPSDEDLQSHHGDRAGDLLSHRSVDAALLWHSGKDLLAALAPRIHALHRTDPKTFCHRLRNWIRDHPASVFEQLPEWAELFRCIAAET